MGASEVPQATARAPALEPKGDGLDDLRVDVVRGCEFSAQDMLRALTLLDTATTRVATLTRQEAVGVVQLDDCTHVLLECRACGTTRPGPPQDVWFQAPPPPNE